MRFFEKRRPSVYFHSARLWQDNKTGKRYWRMNFAVTLTLEDALACIDPIKLAYEHLDTRDRHTTRIELGEESLDGEGMNLTFFPLEESKNKLIRLVNCELESLMMSRTQNLVELWFATRVELSENLSRWVCKFWTTRMWVGFEESQMGLED